MSKVLIIGATSAIATAAARQWADGGNDLFLIARNKEQLDDMAADLSVRGAKSVKTAVADLQDLDMHQALIEEAFERSEGIDIALIAHGTLPKQEEIQDDVGLVLKEINLNGVSVISLSTLIAQRFETAGSGTLAAISSVAGDRGRQSNYVYGAAKSLVSTYFQGLRNRLSKKNVQVLTIKPGFVDTPMTAEFDKSGPLWATPEKVAADILKAVEKGTNELYTPFFWRYIMLIIQHIPEFIFKKLSL